MSLIKHIKNTFKLKKEKNWNYIYITIDIHGSIIKPTHDKSMNFEYYPYAKSTLQFLSSLNYIKLILWSSTYQNKLNEYIEKFKQDNIYFDYINNNTDIQSNEISNFNIKHYTDIGIDDKFGFNPYKDWKKILNFLTKIENKKMSDII